MCENKSDTRQASLQDFVLQDLVLQDLDVPELYSCIDDVFELVELIDHQMWRRPVEPVGTAALYLGLVLSHLVGEGSVVKVLSQLGQQVTLPCSYHYEDQAHISQLSIQWRSPHNELLCHYIKHKAYQNCTAGYSIAYSPGSITLTVQHASVDDFGVHVCSVSKRHEFSDYSVELARMSDLVTSAPKSGGNQSGPTWTLILLHSLWFVCM